MLLAVALGAMLAVVVLGGPAPTPASGSQPIEGRQALNHGDDARASGDLDEADRLYRLAWRDPRSRARAANALRGLERAGRSVPVDETAIRATADLLGPGFNRFEIAHFVVLSDASRGAVRAKAHALERTYDQFFRAMDRMGVAVFPPERRLLCVLFKEHAMYRAFAAARDGVNAEWVAGYYAGLSNRAVFYDDASSPTFAAAQERLRRAENELDEVRESASRARRDLDTTEERRQRSEIQHAQLRLAAEHERLDRLAEGTSVAKTVHEAVHLLAFNTGVQSRQHEYPFWFTEGLATSFETDSVSRAFGPGRTGSTREHELLRLRDGIGALALSDLVARSSAPDDSPEETETAYAQAWSLFEYLHRTERAALAGFIGDMHAAPPGRMSDHHRLELFEARFGAVDRVEERWRRALARSSTPVAAAPDSP